MAWVIVIKHRLAVLVSCTSNEPAALQIALCLATAAPRWLGGYMRHSMPLGSSHHTPKAKAWPSVSRRQGPRSMLL
jgi:hypothetical protein